MKKKEMTWTDEELIDAYPKNIYPDKELVFLEGFYKKQLSMLKAEQRRRKNEVKNDCN
jgi:hypothetical protein